MSAYESTPVQLWLPNARKLFVQSVSFTTSASSVQLNAVTDSSTGSRAIPKGAMYVLQSSSGDFFYDLSVASRAITNANSVRVLQNAQEYCGIAPNDGGAPGSAAAQNQPYLSVMGASTSGTVQVFVVLGS